MPRYLCQMCNTIVTYGENYPSHPCFFYKNNDNVYNMPQLNEPEVFDRTVHETKGNLTRNLNERTGKSFSADKQSHTEESEKINFLLLENNEQISFVNITGKKLSSASDEPANNVPKEKFSAEIHSNENASFKKSTGNLKPTYIYESSFTGDCQRISNFNGFQLPQKKFGSNISALFHPASNEKHGKSFEERKRQSFDNNKLFLLKCREDTPIQARLDYENINNSALSPPSLSVTVKSAEDLVEVSLDRNHSNISHKIASTVPSGSEDRVEKVKVPFNSLTETNAVAGPSGIRVDLLRKAVKRKFLCDVCSKRFTCKSLLDAHYRTHTGERPFVCAVCNKGFTKKGNLEYHSWTHNDKKPFVCDICGKGFIIERDLKRHFLIHTGEKPFVCDVCKKGFTHKSNLKAHARTHTDEKPYECRICGKAFRNLSSRKCHYKKEHK